MGGSNSLQRRMAVTLDNGLSFLNEICASRFRSSVTDVDVIRVQSIAHRACILAG